MKFYRKQRYTYWSNSRPVSFVREKLLGITKPKYASMEGWNKYEEDFKKSYPIFHWMLEEAPDHLQNILMFPIDIVHSIRVYVRNVMGNTHVLDGGLEKGQWYDLDHRISRCLFGELEKYIEKEKGLDHHVWEMSLVNNESMGYTKDHPEYGQPTRQALAAKEQQRVYEWWKANKDRDFMEESGWSTMCNSKTFMLERSEEDAIILEKLKELEEKYQQEEEDMLIALIKIKGSLWS